MRISDAPPGGNEDCCVKGMDERATRDLVPLERAARAIYERVYAPSHRKAGVASSPDLLNGIANAIAALLPLFACEVDSRNSRPLGSEEVRDGLVRDGGRRMIFLDGRSPIAGLAVPAARLDEVARALLKQSS